MTAPVESLPRQFALLGDPVAHSKSPAMHAAAYRVLRLPHTYTALRVVPGELSVAMDRLRSGEFSGFNVTVPYKRRVLDFVDRLAPSAALVGVANTLVREADGTIVAHNTDIAALSAELLGLSGTAGNRAVRGGETAIVLGTGGAARSSIAALAVDVGVGRIVVRGRGLAEPSARAAFVAEVRAMLKDAAPLVALEAAPLRAEPSLDAEASIFVQATSAGMSGAEDGNAVADAVAWSSVDPRAIALDVVYAPPETPFLVAAQGNGLRATNGLGMLARQGALAFEHWLAMPAPYNAMLTALL